MQNRLILHGANQSTWVDPRQIVYICAQGSYCHVALQDGRNLRVSKNLRYVSDKLPACCNFLIRVHKSWIVNINLIESLVKEGKLYYLCVQGGYQVPITTGMRRNLFNLYMAQSVVSNMNALVQKPL